MPSNQYGDALFGVHLDRLDVRHTTFGSFSSRTVFLVGIPPKGTSAFGCRKNDTYASCRGGERCSFEHLSAWCHRCEANQNSSQGLECAACPSGRAPNEQRVQCVPCKPGMYADVGWSKCAECGAGRYAAARSSTSCEKCRRGHYAEGRNHSRCKPCPHNKFQDETGQSSCRVCAVHATIVDHVVSVNGTRCDECASFWAARRIRTGGYTFCV